MKNTYSRSRAFTLIELLIVIAIIGILTSIIMVNLASARSKARDVKRISDIGQIQLALELFYDRCKAYPANSGGGDYVLSESTTCSIPANSSIILSSYISKVPTPPTSSLVQPNYIYHPYVALNDYILSITLENQNEVLKDSSAYTDCGEATKVYCVKPN